MKKMNDIEVMIHNKKYTLSGYESEGYLKTVADYINGKQDEFRKMENYSRLETELKNILLELNIADDYFKAKNQAEELSAENKKKSEELFDLKHELISAQTRLEEAQKELETLKQEQVENQKQIVRLETELKERSYKGQKHGKY